MVLSNKKLKQKLRAELASSLSESVAKADSHKDPNRESRTQSLKLLLNLASQRPRLSKREKRRENVSICGPEAQNCDNRGEEDEKESGSEVLRGEKRKKKRKREADGEGKGVVLGSEENGVVKKSKNNKKRKKNKNKKNKKRKTEEGKEDGNGKLGNEEQMVSETNEKNNSQANGSAATKVYAGGIPYYSTEDDIRSYFEGCGSITEVDCMTFPESGRFRGIAIISFQTEAAMKRALALNGSDMGGLFLTILPYNANRTNKTSDFAPEVVEGYNRIYVGNLSWDISEDKLKNFFSDCKVLSIRFGMDKETGEFRGYAHVDFADSLSLTMALKLDQKVVCGRPARIRCAVPLKKAQTSNISVPSTAETAPKTTETTRITIETSPRVTGTADTNSGLSAVASTGKMKRRTCYECGEKGHISSDCPKKQTAGPTNATAN